jgi:FdhE protein
MADACWATMLAARPELDAAIALQRHLIGHVLALTTVLEGGPLPRFSLPPRYLTAKLRSGIPAISAEPIPLPVEMLRPTLLRLCQALADGGGGDATRLMRDAVEAGRLDVPSLLTLTLRREQAAVRAAATRSGLGHDLLWLVADLTVSPFAHRLLDALFGAVPAGSPLADALDGWTRGYCPHCGSWPSLVEDHAGVQRLRCAFCAAAWERPTGSCLYCDAHDRTFTTLVPDQGKPGRRVEMCGTCRGYTKVVGSVESLPFPLVALVDLESMDLDLAAIHLGYARPTIKPVTARR